MTLDPSFEDRTVSEIGRLRNIVIVLAVAVLLGIGLAAYGFAKASSATNTAAFVARHQAAVARRVAAVAHRNAMLAAEHATTATVLAQDLAREREQTIFRDCQQQNQRHKATVRELDRELRQVARRLGPAQRKQLRASRRFTLLLIDRLAPLANCRRQVALDTR